MQRGEVARGVGMKVFAKRILRYIVTYGTASALAYGLYWIGGGEGRSFELAYMLGASWFLAAWVLIPGGPGDD